MFGTDGIRGEFFSSAVNPIDFIKIVSLFSVDSLEEVTKLEKKDLLDKPKIAVARDTRSSGIPLYHSVVSAITSFGIDVVDCGIMHVGGLSMITNKYDCIGGIMITASHNTYNYNGLKLLNFAGEKISKETKERIQGRFDKFSDLNSLVDSNKIGLVRDLPFGLVDYLKSLFKIFKLTSLEHSNLKLVVDTANGALFKIAKEVFSGLGIECIFINNKPNGVNINHKCGAISPDSAVEEVLKNKADLGICFDGDGDRIVVINNKGRVVCGEELIAFLVSNCIQTERYKIKGDIVTTKVSNSAISQHFKKELNKDVLFSDVGDQNIYNLMREVGSNFGAEESGHFILSDILPVSDAIVVGLLVVLLVCDVKNDKIKKTTINNCFSSLKLNPVFKGEVFASTYPLSSRQEEDLKKITSEIQQKVKKRGGKVILRPSGTEPKIKIYIECENEKTVKDFGKKTKNKVESIFS